MMYSLLTSQKNEVFKIIQEQGLEPANFSWDTGEFKHPPELRDLLVIGEDDDTHKVPKLIYKNTQFYFQFELKDGKHHCIFSPGKEKPLETQFPGNWTNLIHYLTEWLHHLKREIEAPELWAEMEKYKVSFSLALPEQILNEPISANEAENINKKISMLADKIEEQFELTDEQNQFVRGKLNYLSEAVKRQRSVDFIYTVIGVSVTIATALTLAPDRARELWELMKSLMSGFIHFIS